MDNLEFIGKIADQHAGLLKVIELQNSALQTLNQRINALNASQMVIFSLLLEDHGQRHKIARHLRAMLDNPQINASQFLVMQLHEFLELCEDSLSQTASVNSKPAPAWLKGVVQGGRTMRSEFP